MVNLMSVDAEHVEVSITSLYKLWSGPLQMIVSLSLLYTMMGPAMFTGKLRCSWQLEMGIVGQSQQLKRLGGGGIFWL